MIELTSLLLATVIGIGVMALLEFGIIKPYLQWRQTLESSVEEAE